MSTSSKNTYPKTANILISFPIFKSIRSGLKLLPHIQDLYLKSPDKELSNDAMLDELALYSLIGILFQPTPSVVEEVIVRLGDKSKEDSPVENPQDKPNQESSEEIPAQGGPGEVS